MSQKENIKELSFSSKDVTQYKQHIQARISEDLQESLEHLNSHNEQLHSLLDKLHLGKSQV